MAAAHVVVAALWLGLACAAATQAAQRPNILLVVADDLVCCTTASFRSVDGRGSPVQKKQPNPQSPACINPSHVIFFIYFSFLLLSFARVSTMWFASMI